MADYLSKAALLAALTHTHEKTVDSPFLGGRVLIRELTARGRMQAQAAARAENPDEPDNGLYQAMLIQMCVVDPETGSADDPRTRKPLFTIDDVHNLMEARTLAVQELIDAITDLSGLGPAAMFSSGAAADGGERDARAGATGSGDTAGAIAGEGPGDTDERGALADQPGDAPGQPVE